LRRFSPWKSRSPLRPGDGGSPEPTFDQKMFVRKKGANLPVGQQFGEKLACHLRLSRSRFSLNIVGTHTGSSAPSPIND
jgi:hypothetical protein